MIQYINKAIGREIKIKKKDYLYFGGTSYLSLQAHFRFKRWVLKGIIKYGVHHGASRNSNVRISLFGKAEKILAKQAGAKKAILVSSGYLAGQMVAKQFLADVFSCLYLPHTHTALKINPAAIETPYNKLSKAINNIVSQGKTPVLFFDTIDFFGQHYPVFNPLLKTAIQHCILVADDSHAFGVCGTEGCGSYSILAKIKCKELIVSTALGKGLGISGGAVFCASNRNKLLRNSPTYGGASPAAMAGLYAYTEAPEIYKKQYHKLHKNRQRFIQGVNCLDFFHYHQGHPAFGFQSPKLSKALMEAGFMVTNFTYPTANDPIMSRIVITAGHKKKDIEMLCKALNTLLKNKNFS